MNGEDHKYLWMKYYLLNEIKDTNTHIHTQWLCEHSEQANWSRQQSQNIVGFNQLKIINILKYYCKHKVKQDKKKQTTSAKTHYLVLYLLYYRKYIICNFANSEV